MEHLINEYLDLSREIHEKHLDLIRRYTDGLVSFDTYRIQDAELTAKKEVMCKVNAMMLGAIKRSKGE